MRHVTDGELHAFLDGGLDLLPEERGGEVRDHIASCHVCQERLQDEETLRAEATNILGDPPLGEVALPSFEELRERAAASGAGQEVSEAEGESESRYRGPLRGLPLAWAATIVLAVGVGWMGGQVFSSLPSGQRPDGPGVTYVPAERPPAILTDLDTDPEMEESVGSATVEPGAAPAPTGSGPEALAEAREEAVAERLRQDQAGVSPPPIPEQPMVAEARRARAEDAPDGQAVRVSSDVQDLPDRVLLGLTAAGADSAARAPLMERALFKAAEGQRVIGADPDSLERSLAVPGLQVETIEWEERVPGEKALLIRQLLPPSDTLELRYLGLLLGTDPQPQARAEVGVTVDELSGGRLYANVLEASLPPGWNQVVMERARGLLVARATISEANLKALLKSLH